MSIAEAGPQPQATPKRRREPLTGEALLAFVADLVMRGADAMTIARRASIPHPHALKLKDELFARLYQGVETRYGPETLASMKAELTETLVETIRRCRKHGKDNPRAFTHLNTAIKLLNQMNGFNAPQQVETTDRKVYALVNPAMHARIMADPVARQAMLALEEFAAVDAAAPIEIRPVVEEGGES